MAFLKEEDRGNVFKMYNSLTSEGLDEYDVLTLLVSYIVENHLSSFNMPDADKMHWATVIVREFLKQR